MQLCYIAAFYIMLVRHFYLFIISLLVMFPGQAQSGNPCWKMISAGAGFTIAIKADGSLWVWGSNSIGQLGIGASGGTIIPKQVGTGNNWKMVSAAFSYTVALKNDGTLWAWGGNYIGQLGDGTNTDRNTPTQVGIANDWKSVSARGFHTVALKNDGTLWAWGSNTHGELGDGTNLNRNVPTKIGTANNWASISASSHTVAIKTDAVCGPGDIIILDS
jgi:alpha-tubulin suppressor-like RCC1 family protein